MTKNLNWEISTKNLVTFKRWDRVMMKNFKIVILILLKNLIFRGVGVHEKTIFWRGEG